jgi:methionyl-tRNA formyltransferase
MTRSDTVVFLIPADAIKSSVVLESLLADDHFADEYEIKAVLDQASGRTRRLLDRFGVTSVVAADPGEPTPAIERAVDGEFEYLVSCGWTELIPPDAIDLPGEAALNCHGSYLPDYKGPAVHRTQWAHAARRGGATVHHLAEEFDAGKIVCRERFRIGVADTPKDILLRSAELTAVLLREALLLVEDGYEGVENEGGEYYSLLPWRDVVLYGTANRLLRTVGSERRLFPGE